MIKTFLNITLFTICLKFNDKVDKPAENSDKSEKIKF